MVPGVDSAVARIQISTVQVCTSFRMPTPITSVGVGANCSIVAISSRVAQELKAEAKSEKGEDNRWALAATLSDGTGRIRSWNTCSEQSSAKADWCIRATWNWTFSVLSRGATNWMGS
eukprot:TRINITY_DN23648_c0_g1_i1.p2 TRINITY_DN23648_c0_g1~~TRINITY_DN23648_c0_g1_i1.p2  ORF type:complete len:118 (-),score=3.71 TRINITY_DN23648_c0_g1_i1:86-439(-)